MFVTTHNILKSIVEGVILSFVSFLCIVFSNPVHGNEATGEKVEFYFSIVMEYLVKHASNSF